jgi:hypothetical protein
MKNNYHRLRASQDAIMNSLSRFISKKYVINIWQSIKMQLLVSNWRREYVMIEEAGPTIAWLLNLDNWREELVVEYYKVDCLHFSPIGSNLWSSHIKNDALPDLARISQHSLAYTCCSCSFFFIILHTFDWILLEKHDPKEK